jgi:ParB family transcriptional regulator, chromosome partitioning protein
MPEVSSIQFVELSLINEPPDPPRDADDQEKIMELAHSLSTLGQLQNIVLRPNGSRFDLIAGRRRTRAARIANLPGLHALILDPDADTGHLQTLQENLFRVPLTPLEEADAIGFLHYERRWELKQISQSMHKSVGWVEDRISLLHAPDEIKAQVRDQTIGLGVALELSGIPDDEARAFYLAHAMEHGVTVDIARRWRVEYAQQAAIQPPTDGEQGPRLPLQPTTPTTFQCGMCENDTPIAHTQILRLCPPCLYNLQVAKQNTPPSPQIPPPAP